MDAEIHVAMVSVRSRSRRLDVKLEAPGGGTVRSLLVSGWQRR